MWSDKDELFLTFGGVELTSHVYLTCSKWSGRMFHGEVAMYLLRFFACFYFLSGVLVMRFLQLRSILNKARFGFEWKILVALIVISGKCLLQNFSFSPFARKFLVKV